MRLNHAISITHKIWLLPKSLHICICHKGKRLSSTSSFVVYVVETWEKIRNLLTKKMPKNKFQKVNSLRTFLGNWIFHAKLYYTMPKMSKNGKIKTWLQFCHSWLWTKSWSMIFKVPFYLFDQSGHKTIHDFCYYITEDILGQH